MCLRVREQLCTVCLPCGLWLSHRLALYCPALPVFKSAGAVLWPSSSCQPPKAWCCSLLHQRSLHVVPSSGFQDFNCVFLSPEAPNDDMRRLLKTHKQSHRMLYLQGSPMSHEVGARVLSDPPHCYHLPGVFKEATGDCRKALTMQESCHIICCLVQGPRSLTWQGRYSYGLCNGSLLQEILHNAPPCQWHVRLYVAAGLGTCSSQQSRCNPHHVPQDTERCQGRRPAQCHDMHGCGAVHLYGQQGVKQASNCNTHNAAAAAAYERLDQSP